MGVFNAVTVVLVLLCLVFLSEGEMTKPNIVLIIADDMGWDDVSFHGSNHTLTPNIDLLAYTGVTLGSYYTHCACSPSRAALLTGKFAYTTGMQGYPLTNSEDRGLPLTEKILPQYLKELGYSTHLVGKWHQGQSRTAYTPTHRGFDTFFGHRGGYVDYYEYTKEETLTSGKSTGLDLYRNMTPAWDVAGYLTDVYTKEATNIIKSHDESSPLFLMLAHNAPHSANEGALLQAPPEVVREMRHVESAERRIFAAMMKKLDDSIGDVVEALHQKNALSNTILVFIGDNGGMTLGISHNYANNYPLRGLKFSPFEGGGRVAGLIWSPNLINGTNLWKGRMHVVDWLPTLLKAVGGEPPSNIDGVDLWDNIVANQKSKRKEIYEIDDYAGFNTVISGDYKLITGEVIKEYSNHEGENLRAIIGRGPSYEETIKDSKMYDILKKIDKEFDMRKTDLRNYVRIDCKLQEECEKHLCYPGNGTVCLYNITEDPCELEDLSEAHPEVVKRLQAKLQVQVNRAISKPQLFRDPRSSPSLFNYTWSVWADDIPMTS